MADFKQQLIDRYGLSGADWDTTVQFFTVETFNAGDYFVQSGKVSNRLGFLWNGLFRSYYYDDKGKEITLNFFTPGKVVISPDSFNNRIPATDTIVAYEKSEIAIVTYEDMMKLYEQVPIWQLICKDVAEMKNKDMTDRTIAFQTQTASERYAIFCTQYPEVIRKVPIGHIASYLGIDIATLSRIRKKS